jgi:hypothetical protein
LILSIMSPSLSRALRAMSVPLLVVSALAAGGTLAWVAHEREALRVQAPTVCSRVIEEAYGIDASTVSDSVLLGRVALHRDRCMSDAGYVDQMRRLMLNLQRTGDARALLDEAERRRSLTPDELAAERAWVDVEESRVDEAKGDSVQARAARARAVATLDRLRERWPEWALPYTIMGEMNRTSLAQSGGPVPPSEQPEALQRTARQRLANGAIVRSLTEAQALVVAFLAGVLGVLGLATIMSALTSTREMQRMTTSAIDRAQPGYVELKGTLHLPPRADAVIGPLSKHAGVWYAVETNLGSKGSQTFRERSAQAFLLRDSSGEVAIEPGGLTVRTRHSMTKYGKAGGLTSGRRTTERMLWEGDEAYVLGELATMPNGGATTRRVRVPEDGRRLIVSNYSEAQLIWREMLILALGCVLVVLSVATIFWGYAQRFQIRAMPGVLE